LGSTSWSETEFAAIGNVIFIGLQLGFKRYFTTLSCLQ
jgi:hypothetical protein